MITSAILFMFTSVFGFLLGFLPTFSFPSSITAGIQTMVQYIQAYSFIFPVDTLVTVLLLALAVHFGVLMFRSVNWILGKIRGSN